MTIMITTRDIEIINRARDLAATSKRSIKHSAIITYKGKIISEGVNTTKTHPIMRRYNDYTITVHAEAAAIIRGKDVSACTLYSIRNLQGKLGNSKPCPHCMAIILESGITTILYVENGIIKKERLN